LFIGFVCGRLWYCFNLNVEAFSGQQEFGAFSYRCTERHLYRRLVFCLMPFLIYSIIGVFTSPAPSFSLFPLAPDSCGATSLQFGIFWITVHLLEAVAFLIAAYLLRNVWDAYSIREELVICCGVRYTPILGGYIVAFFFSF
jgi:hypothetical protein